MSTFGDIERTFADLYEYRWAMLAGILVVAFAIGGFAYWKGVHRWMWQRRVPVAIISTPPLIVMIWLGWSLGSPLFTNKTVEEEFPLSFSAVMPVNMEAEEAETIMVGMSKIELMVDEAMPELMSDAIAVPEAAASPVALRVGNFKDADSFHRGKGQATIYRGADGSHLLRLQDLDVTNGPDLHVVLSPHEDPDESSQVKTEGYLDLGKLKGNRGNQNYPIPADADVSIFGSVVIYCKPFSVVFSAASLEGAT